MTSTSWSYRVSPVVKNPRWYSSYLNQFIQPDTLIPDPGNSADWNRYAYVNYNPINFNDPTGHSPIMDGEDNDVLDYYSNWWTGSSSNAALQWADDLGLPFANSDMRDNFPDYIPTDDPFMFAGYVYLYNSTTSFITNPYTGATSTGHEMALWIAENEMRLDWDWEINEYVGSTHVTSHLCTYKACALSSYPDQVFFKEIWAKKKSPSDMAGAIAHEIFHKMNFVKGVSQTEELLAYNAQYTVANDPRQSKIVTFTDVNQFETIFRSLDVWDTYRVYNQRPSDYWYWQIVPNIGYIQGN